MSSASTVGDRARAGTARRGSPRRARRRPRASRTAPNCGSVCRPAISSRDPFTIGITSSSTGPSSGRGERHQVAGRGRAPRRRRRGRAAPGRARSCGRSRRRRASPPRGSRARSPSPRPRSPSAPRDPAPSARRWVVSSCFEAASERVRVPVGTAGDVSRGGSARRVGARCAGGTGAGGSGRPAWSTREARHLIHVTPARTARPGRFADG